jgi:hypothetical protein
MMLNCQRSVLINLWTMYHKYCQKMYGRDSKDQWHKATQEKETGKEKVHDNDAKRKKLKSESSPTKKGERP